MAMDLPAWALAPPGEASATPGWHWLRLKRSGVVMPFFWDGGWGDYWRRDLLEYVAPCPWPEQEPA